MGNGSGGELVVGGREHPSLRKGGICPIDLNTWWEIAGFSLPLFFYARGWGFNSGLQGELHVGLIGQSPPLNICLSDMRFVDAVVCGKFVKMLQPPSVALAKTTWDLGLSTKVANLLERYNIKTAGDLVKLNEVELDAIPGIGKASIWEIEQALSEHGLTLR